METLTRKPFQGVLNVIKFNWHFYALAVALSAAIIASALFLPNNYRFYCVLLALKIIIPSIISLVVTYYIYDYSKIYNLHFLNNLIIKPTDTLVNINAGFDEFSFTILEKFKTKNLRVFDFYNPEKHPEISIERARKTTKNHPNTKQITTSTIPLDQNSVDFVFLFFSAHEIRNAQERTAFFEQINQKLKQNGKIIVLEHLRDLPNFIAYTVGFFHFISKKNWVKTFQNSNLKIQSETKITPFLSLLILQKNGTAS